MLKLIDTKAKAPAISVFALLSLVLFACSAMLACSFMTKWYGIIAGAVLMLSAIPFHCIGKKAKWGYIVSFLLNSIANGFSLSAVYIKNGYEPKLSSMLSAIIPSAVILLLACLVLYFFGKSKKVAVTLACIADVAMMAVYIAQWITKDNDVFSSFAFFCLLITFFYLCVFGFAVNNDRRNTLRFISFGSFGAFIVLTFVVIFIVSEGDVLDGVEILADPDVSGKKGRKKKGSL